MPATSPSFLTRNGPGCERPDRQHRELFLRLEDIGHRAMKTRRPQSNGSVVRPYRTLLVEHFRVKGHQPASRPTTKWRWRQTSSTWPRIEWPEHGAGASTDACLGGRSGGLTEHPEAVHRGRTGRTMGRRVTPGRIDGTRAERPGGSPCLCSRLSTQPATVRGMLRCPTCWFTGRACTGEFPYEE